MLLSEYDYDPTEVSVCWKVLTSSGINVVFATENGNEATCDQIQMKRGGVAFGILSAQDDVKRIHHDMIKNNNYKNPISWLDVSIENYQGLILPGGHSKGIISYLESDLLKEKIYKYWKLKRPIGAISRGVLLLARIQNPKTDESILKKKIQLPFQNS